ncbi:MAG: transglutaminase-like domain-containing protein [Pirellulaceae bacterium]
MTYHTSFTRRQLQSPWLTRHLNLPALLLISCFTATTQAQEIESNLGVQFVAPAKQRWEIGVVIKSPGNCTGITAAVTVPKSWPEQAVKIVAQQKSPHVRSIRFQTLSNDVTQMIVSIARLTAGDEARAVVTYEVTKSHIVAPGKTDVFRVAKQPSRSLQKYLLPSPFIESRDPRIRALAKQIVTDQASDWKKVEAMFDWVRENINYKFDPQLRGALTALKNKQGDCEEMTSLFVALCRVNKIPARSVWIPGHCYPEFYLEDPNGKGHWFPCQAAGTRAFGSMPEYRPILQKGDSFRLPGQRTPQRYVIDTLQARNATRNLQFQVIRRPLDDGSPAP